VNDTYTTIDGDTADGIAWNYYGTLDGRALERMLLANPGLADYPAALPAGLVVQLPPLDAQVVAKTKGLKLWS
jgi:phage tail protein X